MDQQTTQNKILEVFDSNPGKVPELATQNKLVFIALHVAGKKALRVETDLTRVSFVYKHADAHEISHMIMDALTNGSTPAEAYMVDLCRLILAWNVWETYLNMMRDLVRSSRQRRQFE